jgi:3-oxoacyl-[acyl-carrier-protein] synthase II
MNTDFISPPGRSRRVVITGLGLVSPAGRNRDELWRFWESGRSAAAPIRRFDAAALPVRIAAEVRDFDPRQEIKSRRLLRLLRPGEDFAVVAAAAAIDDAGLSSGVPDPERSGIALGSGKEGPRAENLYAALERATDGQGRIDRRKFIDEGSALVPPQTIIEGLPNACLYYLANTYHLEGVNHNFLSVGGGGAQAVGEAARSILRDDADLMLAGGFDSWVHWVFLLPHARGGLLARTPDGADAVPPPFDRRRSGSIAGEGGALAVLEEREAARRRGAPILGELLGFAAATGLPGADREDTVARHAAALARAIMQALASAGLAPADIDLVHLHGDGTPIGDAAEARAVVIALGPHGRDVPVTTFKSATGFPGSACTVIELAAALEMFRRRTILPIVNLREPDPELPLNYVVRPLVGPAPRRVLLLNRGWPGHFSALVVACGDEGP